MAIAPSKLGRYVVQQGFSWPTNKSDSPNDYSASDETLARRLREKALVRGDVTDAELTEVFQVARREHAEGGIRRSTPRTSACVFSSCNTLQRRGGGGRSLLSH